MTSPVRVADVIRAGRASFLEEYGSQLSCQQRRVLRDVMACRTAALGGHVEQCDDCGHRRVHYNSCRNRHCPRCQAGARAAWFEAREAELLPIPYFHVVFTLPHELTYLALQNQRVVYGLLFRSAADALLEVASNPKHLGARVGILMVLHTWGQNLMAHPHVHCIVTGGGLSDDGTNWIPARRNRKNGHWFFLPVRVLSRVFRGKFIHGLKRAHAEGTIQFYGQLAELADPGRFERWLDSIVRREWVVYAKRPFGGPEQVLKYLARYTHRVAISDARLSALTDDDVSFGYKDYADNSLMKQMTLSHSEFIRRFLLHTLPSGFTRIRYYGLLANRHRHAKLQQCRRLLKCPSEAVAATRSEPETQDPLHGLEQHALRCPICQRGQMVVIQKLHPAHVPLPPRPHLSRSRRCAETSPTEPVMVSQTDNAWDTS